MSAALLDEGRSVVIVAPCGHGQERIVQRVLHDLGEVAVTEWIVATRSAQTLPLAAVAALLPSDAAVPAEPIELFRSVRRTLEERAGGRQLIVAVDDAHLVDPLSAALLHHVESSAGVRLLVAIRAGEPVEDAITALWRDGAALRIDVQPLGPDDVATVLRAVLDGEIDAASARACGRSPAAIRSTSTSRRRGAACGNASQSFAACGVGTVTCGSAPGSGSSSSCAWPGWTTTSAPWCRCSRSATSCRTTSSTGPDRRRRSRNCNAGASS